MFSFTSSPLIKKTDKTRLQSITEKAIYIPAVYYLAVTSMSPVSWEDYLFRVILFGKCHLVGRKSSQCLQIYVGDVVISRRKL